MHCVASRFGYPNYRLSELSLVPISSDNQPSLYKQMDYKLANRLLCWIHALQIIFIIIIITFLWRTPHLVHICFHAQFHTLTCLWLLSYWAQSQPWHMSHAYSWCQLSPPNRELNMPFARSPFRDPSFHRTAHLTVVMLSLLYILQTNYRNRICVFFIEGLNGQFCKAMPHFATLMSIRAYTFSTWAVGHLAFGVRATHSVWRVASSGGKAAGTRSWPPMVLNCCTLTVSLQCLVRMLFSSSSTALLCCWNWTAWGTAI